jgi:hypothetical protein
MTVRIEETTMTSFVLITTHRITPGATDDVVALLARYERRLRSDETGPALREAIARNAAAGVATVVQPHPVAGFSRAAR